MSWKLPKDEAILGDEFSRSVWKNAMKENRRKFLDIVPSCRLQALTMLIRVGVIVEPMYVFSEVG